MFDFFESLPFIILLTLRKFAGMQRVYDGMDKTILHSLQGNGQEEEWNEMEGQLNVWLKSVR